MASVLGHVADVSISKLYSHECGCDVLCFPEQHTTKHIRSFWWSNRGVRILLLQLKRLVWMDDSGIWT